MPAEGDETPTQHAERLAKIGRISPKQMEKLSAQLTDQPEDFTAVTAEIAKNYPALAPYLDKLAIMRGTPSGPEDDRQLEFYQPWDSENPNPGKLTTELFNKDLKDQDLQETIAGDMLHHLGSVDPTTGQPVDPHWMDMKRKMIAARGGPQTSMDDEAYQQEKANPAYQTAPFEDWMQNNRSDAYIRGALFPKQNPEWQHPGVYSPEMQAVGAQMRDYLMQGAK
jgi:hypothetical protein